jgi:hypothetical protein
VKRWSNYVLVLVATLLAFGIWAAPASAQVEYHGPDEQVYPPSCLDLYGDPLLNCFWDTGSSGSGSTGQQRCQIYLNNCSSACATQQYNALKACNTIQDPVAQADCVATADLNAQMCQDACLAQAQSGFCP